MSLWDNLLSSIAVEKEYSIEDPQEAATTFLAYLQDDTSAYNPQLQEAQEIATSMQRVQALRKYMPTKRITTPTYRKYAPAGSPWKEHSAPFPSEYKADVNQRKGIITAYLTVYNDPTTGLPFVDSYKDIIRPGAFSKTISDLDTGRKRKNNLHLCVDLWQHDRKEIIGSIKALTEDRFGVIYEAHLNMGVRRARECIELAAEKQIGSSFGYDPVRWEYKGDIRHLLEVRLHEVSQVTFAACDIAPILNVKQFYVPSNYAVKSNPFAALERWAASAKA